MSSAFAWTEDPEFVAIYDMENTGLEDLDFYLDLITERGAQQVADIGCGTGVLAVELARAGVEVTALDPAKAMIDVARDRLATAQHQATQSGDHLAPVTLIHGEANQLPPNSADAAIMMGHVAQYFLDRASWDAVLIQTFAALRPGGWLTFETRHPESLDLDLWDEENTTETLPHPDGGEYTSWLEVLGAKKDPNDGDLVSCRQHAILPSGKHLSAEETLRYRPLPVLRESLAQVGFTLEKVWGDWDRSRLDADSPELIITARKPGLR